MKYTCCGSIFPTGLNFSEGCSKVRFMVTLKNMKYPTLLFQSNEVRNSYWMELEGLKRTVALLSDFGIKPSVLITDRHISISSYIRNDLPNTVHYHDIWHVAN